MRLPSERYLAVVDKSSFGVFDVFFAKSDAASRGLEGLAGVGGTFLGYSGLGICCRHFLKLLR
jgi:hypothetical protein